VLDSLAAFFLSLLIRGLYPSLACYGMMIRSR
jgi:hypothetical protein